MGPGSQGGLSRLASPGCGHMYIFKSRAHLVQVWPRRRGGRSWGLVWHRWWAASQQEEMRGVRWETVWRAVGEPNAVCLHLFLESEPFKQSRNEDAWFSMAKRCHTGLTFSLIITPYHTPCAQSSYFTLKTADLNLHCASELPGKLTKMCIAESWSFWFRRSGQAPRISLLTCSQMMLMKLVPTSTPTSLASFLLPFSFF